MRKCLTAFSVGIALVAGVTAPTPADARRAWRAGAFIGGAGPGAVAKPYYYPGPTPGYYYPFPLNQTNHSPVSVYYPYPPPRPCFVSWRYENFSGSARASKNPPNIRAT